MNTKIWKAIEMAYEVGLKMDDISLRDVEKASLAEQYLFLMGVLYDKRFWIFFAKALDEKAIKDSIPNFISINKHNYLDLWKGLVDFLDQSENGPIEKYFNTLIK